MKFTRRICTNNNKFDEKRYASLLTVIGYLLNNYIDPAYQRAVILSDASLDVIPQGGTGKGILCNAIAKMRNVAQIYGKNINLDNQFALQEINLDSHIVWFDDVTKNFPFERLFSFITEQYSVERKHKDRFKFEQEYNPKTVITTNYAIKGEGSSFERRKFEFEFCNYYSPKLTPESEFGELFFASWTDDDWNKFYNFMLRCVQVFLAKDSRILPYTSETLKKKRLANEISADFIEYADTLQRNTNLSKSEIYGEFVNTYFSDTQKRNFSQNKFGRYLNTYCTHNGINLETVQTWNGFTKVYCYCLRVEECE
ncbi:DNA primase [Candidatus Magnetobacterium bavaricum]|uniref:DNA primase n=1 Tax=Candidatus Magnetobacterium bavaricum TaxID=29290 RepID=A0A0F3GP35_9BACT|nr:DNA primase [Candidatus Magnetobacterium bavaricum]